MMLPPNLLVHSSKGGLVDPQLRASNEHIPIVRVPRARGRPGCPVPFQARSFSFLRGWPGLVPNCARRTTTALSWGFREQRGLTGLPPLFSNWRSPSAPGGG